jgi:hypothetical protein
VVIWENTLKILSKHVFSVDTVICQVQLRIHGYLTHAGRSTDINTNYCPLHSQVVMHICYDIAFT